jgi:hypothetical protein
MNRVEAAKAKDRTEHPFHARNRVITIERLIEQEENYESITGKRGGCPDEPMWFEMALGI